MEIKGRPLIARVGIVLVSSLLIFAVANLACSKRVLSDSSFEWTEVGDYHVSDVVAQSWDRRTIRVKRGEITVEITANFGWGGCDIVMSAVCENVVERIRVLGFGEPLVLKGDGIKAENVFLNQEHLGEISFELFESGDSLGFRLVGGDGGGTHVLVVAVDGQRNVSTEIFDHYESYLMRLGPEVVTWGTPEEDEAFIREFLSSDQ